jgi:hypothetical protein
MAPNLKGKRYIATGPLQTSREILHLELSASNKTAQDGFVNTVRGKTNK